MDTQRWWSFPLAPLYLLNYVTFGRVARSVLVICVVCYLSLQTTEGYITYLALRMPLKGERAPPGSPWPMPKKITQYPQVSTIDPNEFKFTANIDCDIITKAFGRYKPLVIGNKDIKQAEDLSVTQELKVVITSRQCGDYPSMLMDESYELDVDVGTATLKAKEVWGCLRGLETFSQLVYYQNNEIFINKSIVVDSPRFKYRGTHIDTARHYMPVPVLKDNLDAMSYNKMNVFHWHIVDDQAFPFVSQAFPELSNKGAYSDRHVYTPSDVKGIIEYARVRGIRVIPEFDSPGHTHSWGNAFPELLTTCWVNKTAGVPIWGKHASHETFDPTKNSTYDFLKKFFAEITEVFHDEYIHMGMDEIYHSCWESNINVTAFMKEHGMGKNFSQLELYYSDRALRIISDLNRKYIIWQDPVDHGAKVRNDSIVMLWKGGRSVETQWPDYMEQITSLGYNTILTSCWYLNYIKYPPNWEEFYECEPHNFTGSEEDKDRVLGGETCIWTEYVDATNLLSRMWPRASAAAERLWSLADVNDTVTAKFRLDEQRCRMVRRGIPAEPILDGYCGDYEWGFEKALEGKEAILKTPEHSCTGGSNKLTPQISAITFTIILVCCMRFTLNLFLKGY